MEALTVYVNFLLLSQKFIPVWPLFGPKIPNFMITPIFSHTQFGILLKFHQK